MQLLVSNPPGRRRGKKSRKAGKSRRRRTAKQRAAFRRMLAGARRKKTSSRPASRRRRASKRRRRINRNPPGGFTVTRRRRRRSSSRGGRRRRRSGGGGGRRALGGFVPRGILMTAGASAAGFVGTNMLLAKLPLPAQLRTGYGRVAAKAATALAIGYALKRSSLGKSLAIGGLVAAALDAAKLAAPSLPLAGFNDPGMLGIGDPTAGVPYAAFDTGVGAMSEDYELVIG